MKQRLRKFLAIIQIVLSFLIATIAGYDMIGKPTRLAPLIALIAGCFGVGVSTGVYAEKKRSKRRNEKLAE
jgi:hypothetical protein